MILTFDTKECIIDKNYYIMRLHACALWEKTAKIRAKSRIEKFGKNLRRLMIDEKVQTQNGSYETRCFCS